MGLYRKYRSLAIPKQTHLKDRLVEKGCYGPARNLELYEKHFEYMPNRLSHLLHLHSLGEKKVLDVGCGYGQFLIHFGPGSVGIELDPERHRFAKSLGLEVLTINFEESWKDVPEKSFDFVWACNVLEHTVSPFLFLKKLHRVLKPGGAAIIGIPTIPSNPVFETTTRLLFGKLGYQSLEHTTGFTPKTAAFLLERTGFEVEDANVFVSRRPWVNQMLKPVLPTLSSQMVLIARQTEDYPRPRILPPRWFETNL